MAGVHVFEFNPFRENTYVLYDSSGECVIIDPGCFERTEKEELRSFIETRQLRPVYLLNTHAHIDHVLGNRFTADTWNLSPLMHRLDVPQLARIPQYAHIFGVESLELPPEPEKFLEAGDQIRFGHTTLDVIFVPGHAPGHVAFVNHAEKYLIGGDVLFKGSIGRTDLPGGDMATLVQSIRKEFYVLPDDFVVYPGHGPETSIGEEKKYNPFVAEHLLAKYE